MAGPGVSQNRRRHVSGGGLTGALAIIFLLAGPSVREAEANVAVAPAVAADTLPQVSRGLLDRGSLFSTEYLRRIVEGRSDGTPLTLDDDPTVSELASSYAE